MAEQEARSGGITFNGKMPFVAQSGLVTASGSGVVNGLSFVAPCDGYIKKVELNVVTQGGGASALINLSVGGTNYVEDLGIDTLATGAHDITGNLEVSEGSPLTAVSAGDVIQANIENTATGAFAMAVVVFPE